MIYYPDDTHAVTYHILFTLAAGVFAGQCRGRVGQMPVDFHWSLWWFCTNAIDCWRLLGCIIVCCRRLLLLLLLLLGRPRKPKKSGSAFIETDKRNSVTDKDTFLVEPVPHYIVFLLFLHIEHIECQRQMIKRCKYTTQLCFIVWFRRLFFCVCARACASDIIAPAWLTSWGII